MQITAGRRAFSILSSKIHPQLPLSPRESQQLLSLLTTSFRQHLDREHPVSTPENDHMSRPRNTTNLNTSIAPRSSQSSASKHIDSILTNPLFAVKPQRRGSDSLKAGDAQMLLKDPLKWFLDQVAAGTADIPKAVICLNMLKRISKAAGAEASHGSQYESKPGSQIAKWLWSSDLENSRPFLENSHKLIDKLVPVLVREGEEAPLWRWLEGSPQQRIDETGLELVQLRGFRIHLLKTIISAKIASENSLDGAIKIFLQAVKLMDSPEYGIRAAGIVLVNHIITHPGHTANPKLYDAFLRSILWTRGGTLIRALLWLQHPTNPTARPGLLFLQSPSGARLQMQSTKKRPLFVQLCLGVARQLLAEQNYADAQWTLEFAREYFPDLVSEHQPVQEKAEPNMEQPCKSSRQNLSEQENLQMLDRLLPG
ncbi:hypothetical protein K469DRAFT_556654 [Zopfia rhizophila CBS 207.26]|uniref:Uncharacterized protein n=1 Tax=Zopfia rhizophila CBS 207.26 TaxID=1314779 RepID=A0A6A6EH87_9PEZI|nr:hypothetical protein K469DRAFT_556654 [Zopfia rhizophila CBS 207.26]